MTYFLEYVTGVSAGHFAVEGVDFSAVLARAKEAVRGLDCTKAVLLYTTNPVPVFGAGHVLAAYSRINGWTS